MTIRPRVKAKRLAGIPAALLLTAFLCLSFKTESLWTDEAFSAFIACHRSLSSLWHTLLAGDSSDLQMWLYYTYLHFWVQMFGDREFTLRSANIPFLLIYSLAIVWTRNRLFRFHWIWLAAFSPFVWAYGGDTRPYMCIVSLSTVFVLCLFASLTDPRHAGSSKIPWVGLVALLIGLNLHMLMFLLIPPALVMLLTYRFASGSTTTARTWLRPALFLSPLFLAYFAFLLWTFGRGTSYDYSQPDWRSMAAVLFRFFGLAGFAPNRHYDVAFGPYLAGMLLASLAIVGAGIIAITAPLRTRHAPTIALAAALLTGLCEALTLSLVFKQQIEVRHLACLFALLLFLLFSCWECARENSSRRALLSSILLVVCVWSVSDFRMTYLPAYRREDFRDAVATAIALAESDDAQIAVVADPAAAAYYGLRMQGDSPCFPLPGNCADALARVAWPQWQPALEATFWKPPQIAAWLAAGAQLHHQRIVLISRSRHPLYNQSAWWPALRTTTSYNEIAFHGFSVYVSALQEH